jgi:hypothetical protein
LQRDPELSEIPMRAFILRRLALMGELAQDTVLLGSRHSGATQSIRQFLSRNGQPFVYQDVETDPSVQKLGGGADPQSLGDHRRVDRRFADPATREPEWQSDVVQRSSGAPLPDQEDQRRESQRGSGLGDRRDGGQEARFPNHRRPLMQFGQ